MELAWRIDGGQLTSCNTVMLEYLGRDIVRAVIRIDLHARGKSWMPNEVQLEVIWNLIATHADSRLRPFETLQKYRLREPCDAT